MVDIGHLNVLQSFLDDHNAGRIEEVMENLDPEVEFEVRGLWKKVGEREIRDLMAWNAAINCRLMVRDCELGEHSVTCKMSESSDWLRELGIEEIDYTGCRFDFEGGRLKRIRTVLSEESIGRMNEALAPVIEWALEERPRLIDSLIEDGEFIYNEENARRWMQLIGDWKERASE